MCRFQFATQIFSTSLLFFLTPFLTLSSEVLKRLMYYYLFGQPIDGQRYVHHNSSRIKNVKIPVSSSQPLTILSILVLWEVLHLS